MTARENIAWLNGVVEGMSRRIDALEQRILELENPLEACVARAHKIPLVDLLKFAAGPKFDPE